MPAFENHDSYGKLIEESMKEDENTELARMERWMQIRDRVTNLGGMVQETLNHHGRSVEVNFKAGGLEVAIFEYGKDMAYPLSEQTLEDLGVLLDMAERRKSPPMTQSELNARALIAGDLLREGEVTRVETFRVEMDAALGENTGDLKEEKNTDFEDCTM